MTGFADSAIDLRVAKFSKSGVWDKVTKGSIIIFIPKFPYNTVWDRLKTHPGPTHHKQDDLPCNGLCCLCKSFFFLVGECFFWYPITQVVPDKRLLNGCACVCVCKRLLK